ncbi:bifunctional [glutamine synthetase] adenylyltransferase/[glutamine synthetase]-adenylyl-L-tyrosine phosphorylase [Aestuariimicrobium ganziense]|uniref:bifunctional [glutamine synthetase] adenylyltransferase/[glutamine synthetase]-adenylyl-L-tyrosine phosphorylase n=1 Tax=Aestuariimicrobium ganziense TaxID=2773677 RepID=UPI0019438A23|nr:bifunctional [glutamine synthetase] adenylyltransferase/[glutamine synthetase]-adenylyl-L-tyrosine phosphorylase [Aestuariimicrobium ganziense]
MNRIQTTPGELARRGITAAESTVALERLATAGLVLDDQLALFERVPDPDQALALLADLADASPDLPARLRDDLDALARLLGVLGGSHALGIHLVRHPADVEVVLDEPRRWSSDEIRDDLLAAVGAQPDPEHPDLMMASNEVAEDDGPRPMAPGDRLRLANRRQLCRIAARDLPHPDPVTIMDDVAGELSDLADAVLHAALAIARLEVPQHARARLAVIGLGKCGAQELNYLSDVDVLFVAEPADDDTSTEVAMQVATKVAGAMTRVCSGHGQGGSIWELDAALRPEGKAGPLVRTLASMEAYYRKWARNWEFQAMLKARPVCGDLELGEAFVAMLAPMVWSAVEREHFMAETQSMRQRVVDHIPSRERPREIKLSEGGLRDTEFTVQLLQLVHGRADESLRVRATLPALHALVDGGYIGRAPAAELDRAYRFQRTMEHRAQLARLRRTHLVPDDPSAVRALGRAMRLGVDDDLFEAWRDSARQVRQLHQRVFYSPLLEAVARIPSPELRLTPDAARDRMRALGFDDPAAALRHIEALTRGTTRAAQIQRQLMPAMLGWLASAPNPDHGLLAFRQVSEALGDSPWYLRALRDEGAMAERLARLLSTSRLVVDLLKRAPDTVQLLADDAELTPRSVDDLTASMRAVAGRHRDPADAIKAIRAVRRRELFRIAVADLTDRIDLTGVGYALTDLTCATVDAALDLALAEVEDPPRLGVVAMGRWGGREMAYGSDADAMFVVADSDDPDAVRKAGQVVTKLRSWLTAPGPDPGVDLDPDLRPEGKGGPMVRSLSSYLAYYQRWSDTWEAQALVRAGHGAGDRETVQTLLDEVGPRRHPAEGISRAQLADIRKLKARMEVERVPRGTDPNRNVKLGPGGLSDVEWTVQLLQLQHAGRLGDEHPGLRTTETLAALQAAVDAELIESSAAATLREAWVLASRIRNAIMLSRGRASDVIPSDAGDLPSVTVLLGYGPGRASELLEDHRRAARRAARVVEHYFWGRE